MDAGVHASAVGALAGAIPHALAPDQGSHRGSGNDVLAVTLATMEAAGVAVEPYHATGVPAASSSSSAASASAGHAQGQILDPQNNAHASPSMHPHPHAHVVADAEPHVSAHARSDAHPIAQAAVPPGQTPVHTPAHGPGSAGPTPFRERIVHIDMKGAPPPPAYLMHLMTYLAAWGATGVLIEWEDMFPYSDPLQFITNAEAYTPEQVQAVLRAAAAAGLEVIPLVQTLGHAEYVLKHADVEEPVRIMELREDPDSLMDMCPSHPHTLPIVREMLNQVARAHAAASLLQTAAPASMTSTNNAFRRIHIGLDEVFGLASCKACRARVDAFDSATASEADAIALALHSGQDGAQLAAAAFDASFVAGKGRLFLEHAMAVIQHVRSLGLTPLLWHDMVVQFGDAGLRLLAGAGAELVAWSYTPDPEAQLQPGAMQRLAAVHDLPVWVASAFRGASVLDAVAVPTARHIRNHVSWLGMASSLFFPSLESSAPPAHATLRGIILTGWARFNHITALCELLPAALLSIRINLGIVSGALALPWSAVPAASDTALLDASVNALAAMDAAAAAAARELAALHAHLDGALGPAAVSTLGPNSEVVLVVPSGAPSTPLASTVVVSPLHAAASPGGVPTGMLPPSLPSGWYMCHLAAHLEHLRDAVHKVAETRRMFFPPYTSRYNAELWQRVLRQCITLANAFDESEQAFQTALQGLLTAGGMREFVDGKIRAPRRDVLLLAEDLIASIPSSAPSPRVASPNHRTFQAHLDRIRRALKHSSFRAYDPLAADEADASLEGTPAGGRRRGSQHTNDTGRESCMSMDSAVSFDDASGSAAPLRRGLSSAMGLDAERGAADVPRADAPEAGTPMTPSPRRPSVDTEFDMSPPELALGTILTDPILRSVRLVLETMHTRSPTR